MRRNEHVGFSTVTWIALSFLIGILVIGAYLGMGCVPAIEGDAPAIEGDAAEVEKAAPLVHVDKMAYVPGSFSLYRVDDTERGVTCYVLHKGGVDCLPSPIENAEEL